jgi:hypothetical protein
MSGILATVASMVREAAIRAKAPPPPTTPAQIERDYQVQDDEMVQWKPTVPLGGPFGGPRIPVPGGETYTLTRTEAQLLDNLQRDRGLLGLQTFKNIKDDAFAVSDQRFPDAPVPDSIPADRHGEWQGNDGHRDAFRHAYWSARLDSEFGSEWATQFTTAHEALPGNPSDREAMDLYNNSVGIRIATENPNASPADLADLIQQAVDNGELVVISGNGGLAWSNDVPLGEHGLTHGIPADGGEPLPEGNASADS